MSILDDFDSQLPLFRQYTEKLELLLSELLSAENIRVHSVTTRVKERASFAHKLDRIPAKYNTLDQITDVCGVRIITHLADDVQTVATLVEDQFEIDRPNSVDWRQTTQADRFGYLSVHYVAMMKPARTQLPEYGRFRLLKFELQIRSILQHAWAEIEHDLQYKTKDAIPKELQRRFAMLAALLELADDEFTGIKKNIVAYQNRVSKEIKLRPDEVFLDRDSLVAFVTESPLIMALDRTLANLSSTSFSDTISSPSIAFLLKLLQTLNFTTIQSVEVAISANAEHITQFGTLLTLKRRDVIGPFGPGVSLHFYVNWWVIYECKGDIAKMRLLLAKLFGSPDPSVISILSTVYTTIYPPEH